MISKKQYLSCPFCTGASAKVFCLSKFSKLKMSHFICAEVGPMQLGLTLTVPIQGRLSTWGLSVESANRV